MRSLELFAGGGGLGLGLHKAGFHARAVVEWDKWSCDTIRNNKALGFPLVQGWKVVQGDAREFDFASVGEVELVSGGPPCQPFGSGTPPLRGPVTPARIRQSCCRKCRTPLAFRGTPK